jgi:hypothetical protein
VSSSFFFSFFLPRVGDCGHHFAVVPQRFVDFSTDPQLVKQHGQLPRYRNDRSFLGILPSALGELQSPAPQVTVLSKGSENVVCPLYKQC